MKFRSNSFGSGRGIGNSKSGGSAAAHVGYWSRSDTTAFAWTHLGLGDIDEAFEWMDRAVDAPDRMMSPVNTYPFLDPLRADPRFSALLRKMNQES